MSQLVTGEAVALDLRPAALPSRLVAGSLDAMLQFLVLLVVGAFATAVSLDVSSAAVDALSIVLLVVVLIVYPVAFETLMRGRTPGKAAMGLRVVRDEGGPIGFRQALVRGLCGAFIERPGVTFFTGAIFTSLLNERHKRLGDLLAGTVVLRERVSITSGRVASMPPQLAAWASGLDLSSMPDDLALSVRQFISRADGLTPAAREDLGGRLVRAVQDAVGPPPPGTPGWAMLHAVLAERRRRDQVRLGPPRPFGLGPPAGGAPPYGGPPSGPAGYSPPTYGPAGSAPPSYAPPGYGRLPAPGGHAAPPAYGPPASPQPAAGDQRSPGAAPPHDDAASSQYPDRGAPDEGSFAVPS